MLHSCFKRQVFHHFIAKSRLLSTQGFLKSKQIVNTTDAFVFDCDGVLWLGNKLIPGAVDAIAELKRLGKGVYFFTNNSTKSRRQYVEKFKQLGFNDIRLDHIFSSSFAAALYLKGFNLAERQKCVYAIGSSGLYAEMGELGIPCINSSIHDDEVVSEPMQNIIVDPNVEAVVVGFDLSINYYKIQYAQICLNSLQNCPLVATNMDASAYYTPTQLWAENGSIVGAITGCTSVKPTVVGKPSGFIIDYIVNKHGYSRDRMCIVGDRLDTDILLGKQNGMQSVLTLSGVTTEKMLIERPSQRPIIPDCVIASIKDLVSD